MKQVSQSNELDEIFPRNTLIQVVCELRFPAIIDLIERLPESFQNELRTHFPHYNRNWVLEFEPGAVDATREPRYDFLSRDKLWTVSLKPTAISLQTKSYSDFSEFKAKLEVMINAAKSNFELLFFTRVGLRFINKLPVKDEQRDWGHWVNPQLLAPLQLEEFTDTDRFWQEISGSRDGGTSYFLRHGLGVSDDTGYIIDIDISSEDVEIDDALGQVIKSRAIAKRIFLASISEKTLGWLRMTQA